MAVPEIAMWLCLSAMPLMLAATLQMVGSAASGWKVFFFFFGQARAVAHQREQSAREPGKPEGRGLEGGRLVHCVRRAGGESFQSVSLTSGRISSVPTTGAM